MISFEEFLHADGGGVDSRSAGLSGNGKCNGFVLGDNVTVQQEQLMIEIVGYRKLRKVMTAQSKSGDTKATGSESVREGDRIVGGATRVGRDSIGPGGCRDRDSDTDINLDFDDEDGDGDEEAAVSFDEAVRCAL